MHHLQGNPPLRDCSQCPWFPILQMRGTEVEDVSATFSGVPGQWWLSWALGQLWSDSTAQVFFHTPVCDKIGREINFQMGPGEGAADCRVWAGGRCEVETEKPLEAFLVEFPGGVFLMEMVGMAVGGGAACAKALGCETRRLLGKHMCPFLPASFLTSRLSPCHHPRPLHSVLQTEAARTDSLKCESDHVSLSLLQNLQGLILPLKTSKKA